jgi:hypothetical protein
MANQLIGIRVQVKGVREALQKLEAFKDGAVNGLIRGGVSKASSRLATVLRQDVKRISASRTGLLARAIGFRVRRYQGKLWAGVSARAGMARTIPFLGRVNPTKYLHLYERGRKAVGTAGKVIPIATLRGPTVGKRSVLGRGVRSTAKGKVRKTMTRGRLSFVTGVVRPAPGRHLLARRADTYGRFLTSQIVQTVRAGWERLVSNPRSYRTGPADETGG